MCGLRGRELGLALALVLVLVLEGVRAISLSCGESRHGVERGRQGVFGLASSHFYFLRDCIYIGIYIAAIHFFLPSFLPFCFLDERDLYLVS